MHSIRHVSYGLPASSPVAGILVLSIEKDHTVIIRIPHDAGVFRTHTMTTSISTCQTQIGDFLTLIHFRAWKRAVSGGALIRSVPTTGMFYDIIIR